MWLLATDVTTPNWRVEPLGHSVSIPDQVLRVPLAEPLGKKGPGKLEEHNRIEAKSHPLTLQHGHCWCSFAPWQAPPPTKWFSIPIPILLSSPLHKRLHFKPARPLHLSIQLGGESDTGVSTISSAEKSRISQAVSKDDISFSYKQVLL